MEIINERPPILHLIFEAGMKPTRMTVYTYGDKIYNPSKAEITEDLLEHERIHSIQQGDTPGDWWGRYLSDVYFRIDQEAEAYGYQYRFICRTVKDRNRQNKVLWELATFLSGPMYGSIIGRGSAITMIKNKFIKK